MRLLSTHKIDVTRRVANTGYIDPDTRKWVEGASEKTFSITCSLQPISGKNRRMMPEGVSTTHSKLVFSKEPLLTADEHLDQESDTVNLGGIMYEVISVEDWTGYGLVTDHHKSIITRKDKLGGQ